MLFSSFEFIFWFLPATLLVYALLQRGVGVVAAIGWLGLASVFFYGYWRPEYVPLLLFSVTVNFVLSLAIAPGRPRSSYYLILGIAVNLGLLFYFKYAAFVSTLLQQVGWLSQALSKMELPLGISFFTFQQLAFLVDRHRGLAPRGNFSRYLLFVTFFPQLIAGPIVHHREIMPQLENPRAGRGDVQLGLFIFSLGLAKKILLADPLGKAADAGFADPGGLSCVNAWLVVLAYTLQLYVDFSGYSDMAVGLGRLFGVHIPWNFLSPYKCTSIAAFWRHWHITLSNFLRDYLYVPLGGSRRSAARVSLNLFVTMLLGGLWHGAGWTFIAWGALHGLALVVNHAWRRRNLPFPGWLGWAVTMAIVVGGWVLFRAPTIPDALTVYHRMITPDAYLLPSPVVLTATPYLAPALAIALFVPNARAWAERCRPTLAWSLLTGLLLALAMFYVLGNVNPAEFLYYDF